MVFAALLGVPVSAASYGFLALVDWPQEAVFTDLAKTLGIKAHHEEQADREADLERHLAAEAEVDEALLELWRQAACARA
jgi:hypothetical protein